MNTNPADQYACDDGSYIEIGALFAEPRTLAGDYDPSPPDHGQISR